MKMIDAEALERAIGVKTLMQTEWTPATAWGVPIVDAEPVRHGHWKSWYHGEWFSYSCDQCGYGGLLEKTRYCPYCGAKMEEKNE